MSDLKCATCGAGPSTTDPQWAQWDRDSIRRTGECENCQRDRADRSWKERRSPYDYDIDSGVII